MSRLVNNISEVRNTGVTKCLTFIISRRSGWVAGRLKFLSDSPWKTTEGVRFKHFNVQVISFSI